MPVGSENSRLSRRAMPQCIISLSAGRRPCHPTFCRATPRTSVPPFRTSRNWLVKDGYKRPTTTLSYSSVTRHRRRTSDEPISVGRAACLLNDNPIHICVPLLMRPWIMQACHSTASCHLGTTRTLRMLERFYRWIGMNVCTRWWLRQCLRYQARKPPRLTLRWPIIFMPLPRGPDVAISVDYFGLLPVTPRG